MAVIVDVYQDKRKQSNNLWYGRAWHPGVLDTRALAKRIEQNVSVKESDVYAVLIELANVMTYELANSCFFLYSRHISKILLYIKP